jgi:NAD(P)-dependent dehydrogenase (short-subunit alcohol dehydrogenase family)
MAKTILVLGGTGKTGRRVVDRLEARGERVRVGSRSVQPGFDWENAGTWDTALPEGLCPSNSPTGSLAGARCPAPLTRRTRSRSCAEHL